MTQLDDLDLIAVRIQHEGETRTLNFNASQDGATVQPAAFWPLIRYEERSYQQDFQLPVFRVLVASPFFGTNDERSPRNSSSRDFSRNRDKTGRRL
jgi:hypothetical protein